MSIVIVVFAFNAIKYSFYVYKLSIGYTVYLRYTIYNKYITNIYSVFLVNIDVDQRKNLCEASRNL